MINIEQAKKAFRRYLEEFDVNDPKISLKIVHTYGVISYMQQICDRMHCNEEDANLAYLIALLHDIGRFEQIRRFHSFEHTTMSHAHFGCDLLFKENLIREFIVDPSYDAIIYKAIYHHSDYKLPDMEDEKTLFFCKLIRDADKLDNCRVKLEDSIEVMLDETMEQVGSESICDTVWQSCLNQESVLLADRQEKIDYWVSYIAYFFDINFKESFQIIVENDFVSKTIHRITYTNPDTKEKMEYLDQFVNDYVRRKAESS